MASRFSLGAATGRQRGEVEPTNDARRNQRDRKSALPDHQVVVFVWLRAQHKTPGGRFKLGRVPEHPCDNHPARIVWVVGGAHPDDRPRDQDPRHVVLIAHDGEVVECGDREASR